MRYDDRQLREVFHLLFLEKLLKIADPRLFVLKGGVNLRFFFRSPRYSEDMDLDVLGGAVATLKKNGYRVLADAALRRSLQSFGVRELEINDPSKAKHSDTTQRFRVRLITQAGIALPTRVEFSHRGSDDAFQLETIDPDRVTPYRRLAFKCQHYGPASAVRQKILALAHRAEVQARDLFDLYILWRGGHFTPGAIAGLDRESIRQALDNALALDYEDYSGQVLPFIDPEHLADMATEAAWDDMRETVLGLLAKPA